MKPTGLETAKKCLATMSGWPATWAGVPEDIPLGEGLIDEFRPFIKHLGEARLAPATIRRHADNLWVLGGKIVRDASLYDEVHRPAADLLDKVLDPYDGPLISELSEEEQRSLDATCRKFYRFRQ